MGIALEEVLLGGYELKMPNVVYAEVSHSPENRTTSPPSSIAADEMLLLML